MAFKPESTIKLCTVEFDNTYANQIYFKTEADRNEYFGLRVKRRFDDYLVVRKTLPDGSMQSSVKVNANIDELYGLNYMYYQNLNHGYRTFYCFITKLIYINEGTTEIVFETDVYQTWIHDVKLLESFVIREHSETDEIGDNLIQEPFSPKEFLYRNIRPVTSDGETIDVTLSQWGYLIAVSEPYKVSDTAGDFSATIHGLKQSGVYQGVAFYFYTNPTDINKFIDSLSEEGLEAVLAITCMPEFSVSHCNVGSDDSNTGFIFGSDYPASKEYTIERKLYDTFPTVGGGYYKPKNNKLFTYPYYSLVCDNRCGVENEYIIEDFSKYDDIDDNCIGFTLYGDVSVSPTLMIAPRMYKSQYFGANYEYATVIDSMPQCSFQTDAYKIWLARNRYSVTGNIVKGVGSAVVGGALAMAGYPLGGYMMSQGYSAVRNELINMHQASLAPNNATLGSTSNNLLTGLGENRFQFKYKYIRGEHAKIIDDYFTMYGYQTNSVKVPNVSSRPYFNFVQTADVNIADAEFGIPCDDMKRLKKMFNDGVTFWKPNASIGNYSVDNSPTTVDN